MEHQQDSSSKRQKIEEDSAVSFWKWYIPNSCHPKSVAHERGVTYFRFDAAYRVYCTLVRRKWHHRWYMIFILEVSPYVMYTFEVLRGKGCFGISHPFVRKTEFWDQ